MRLTPEQREAVQKKLAANILSKLNRGETITAREQAILDGQNEPSPAVFVRTWDELARAIQRSRRCLSKWRQKFHDAPDFPKPRADGRHDVTAWLAFMAKHNLADEIEPPEETDADGEQSKSYWDRRSARIDYEKKVYSLEVEKQKHLEIDDITSAVGRMLAGFRTALNTMPASAARWLIGVRDFNTIKNKLQEEVDAVLQALGRCDYLETLTASVVAKMYAECDDKFRQDVSKCVDAVYRELGRLALSDLLQRSLALHAPEVDTPIAPNRKPSLGERATDAPIPIGDSVSAPRKRRKKS